MYRYIDVVYAYRYSDTGVYLLYNLIFCADNKGLG
jgi:hypothetical protein